MSFTVDVLIVGGGIVGLTAALAMSERGYRVVVLDAGPLRVDTTVPDSRVYAINQASQSLLQSLGVWQHITCDHQSPYEKMHVWDAVNGACIDFDSRSIAASHLGVILEESHLKQALLQQVATQEAIQLVPQCTVDGIHSDEQGISITAKTQQWKGELAMIADGAQSPTRKLLQVSLTSWSYHQQALVATVQTELPHQKTAYQIFNPDGPLAFLPLTQANQCSIVWSTDPQHADHLMALNDGDFNQELTQAFQHKLGQVELISKRHQFPLQMRHVKQYTGKRWLLLGDAAHTIHPLAGLGLNVGLADIQAWLQCMERNKGALVTNKLLGAYHRDRQYHVWQTIWCMEGFKRLFSTKSIPVSTLRGLGLRACNELTPLKRLFIQHAAGVSHIGKH